MLSTHFNNESDENAGIQAMSLPDELQNLKLKEDFIANLTHDLKSPVFSQIQALKILLDDKSADFKDFQKEILNQLLASNLYMNDMIQNVLMKFKMQYKKIEIEKAPNNLKQTLANAVESVSFMFSDKMQKLSINYKTNIQNLLYDDIEIKRVFNNLLSNAAKYGAYNSQIKVIAEKQGNFVQISIINSGRQIPKDEIDNVFDIYLTSSKKHKTVGTGLGLYISKQIIEAHGGKIFAKNISENEVQFSFLLPIK